MLRGAGWLACVAIAGAVAGGCDCSGDSGPHDGGGGPVDAGPRRDAHGGDGDVGGDAGMSDAHVADPCEGVMCGPFEYCDRGTCSPFPTCTGDGMCPEPGEVCRARRCVPGDVDIDGDGVPASEDCDETNPEISPMATEVCNGIDDDCDMMADEGDPTELCASDPSGGECVMGGCGCPAGRFNVDGMPGCECDAMPAMTEGVSCAGAIDLGELHDDGMTMTVQTANVLPDDREVWYHFRAVDDPDASCDNFHARVQLTANPDMAFEFTVFKGSCTTVECADMGYTDWTWFTDMAMDGIGECPCTAEPGAPGANFCTDNTADFYVRVRRRAGTPVSCAGYSLEFSNGVY